MRPGITILHPARRRGVGMEIRESIEPYIVFAVMIFSFILLVVIDRIGVVRGPVDEEEEEV
jgi:hypothetical protein